MILRAIAIATAIGLLGAAAHAVIVHASGYGTPHAWITLALAAGIAIGALAIGTAWDQGRRALAIVIGVALICGEAFALIATAERLVAQREAAQSPIHEALERRRRALQRLSDETAILVAADPANGSTRLQRAEAAIVAAGSSERLRNAEAAKAAADRAAIDKAAERGCAANCRLLLQEQVAGTAAEVAAARAEVEDRTAAAMRELEAAKAEIASRHAAAIAAVTAARAELEAARLPPSATPLADRLGVPGWSLDLLVAALGSIAANGLGAALLVFAAHGRHAPAMVAQPMRHRDREPLTEIAAPVPPAPNVESQTAARDPAIEADWFALATFRPAPGQSVRLREIREAYRAWCEARSMEPLEDREIGAALSELFRRVNLFREGHGADAAIVGITWAPNLTHANRLPVAA